MKFGLRKTDLQYIESILKQHATIEEVRVFGSRALGTYELASDIDLVIMNLVSFETLIDVKDKLENEGPMPYMVDILNYPSIENAQLRNHIDQHGQVIYKR